jgi:hypothetical protein
MTSPIIIKQETQADLGLSGSIILTNEERTLLRSGKVHRWHAPHLCKPAGTGFSDSMDGAVSEAVFPANPFPIWGAESGPDSQPALSVTTVNNALWRSPDYGMPVENDLSGSWTVALVCKNGTPTNGCIFGIPGSTGDAIGFVSRSGSFIVSTFSDTGSRSTKLSVATTDELHFFVVSYDDDTGIITVHVDGVEEDDATYPFSLQSSKYTLFGTYDSGVAGNLTNTHCNNSILASVMILEGAAANDNDLMAALNAAAESRWPSLF